MGRYNADISLQQAPCWLGCGARWVSMGGRERFENEIATLANLRLALKVVLAQAA